MCEYYVTLHMLNVCVYICVSINTLHVPIQFCIRIFDQERRDIIQLLITRLNYVK